MEPQPTITRTYRVAVKHGDDYTTVEEVVTLPVDASQEMIDQAVATGLSIFEAQRLAVEAQIALIRQAPANEPEASGGQRKLINALASEVGMSEDDLNDLGAEYGVGGWETLTKRQAGSLIDELKRRKAALLERQRAEETPASPEPGRRGPPADQLARARAAQAQAHERAGMPALGERIRNPGEPASEAQLRAISRGANKCGDRRLMALASQVTQVLGHSANPKSLRDPESVAGLQLTKGQASQLIGVLHDEASRASGRAA